MTKNPMNLVSMTVSNNIPKAKGFNRALTLVEVMVSFAILSVVATSLLYGFTLSRRVAEGTIMQSMTTDVAQAFLEQIKVMGYDTLNKVIDDPTVETLATYRPKVSGVSSSIISFPMKVNTDHSVPVTMDIGQSGQQSSFNMVIRPELKNIFGATALPAIEVTLHYSYTSNANSGGKLITGRRVQYVVPKLGSTKT